jgi:glycosyltransferase involved in cell wall biosynthesis
LRKRILLVQQALRPPGGASAVAAWILQALKDEYDLTVLAGEKADLPGLNRFYGTSLRDSDVSVLYPNRLVRGLLRLDPDPGSIQPAAYLMRMCRRYRRAYDLVMAAGMEEMDLGGHGLIYVHYPHLARFWTKYQDSRAGLMGLIRGRTRPWMLLAEYQVERMKRNTFLTNSDWTARQIHEAYGVSARPIYPPVPAAGAGLPWEDREDSFVCVGRLHAGKRMDWIIGILGKLRERHPAIRLHLVGTRDEGRAAAGYYRALRRLVDSNRGWVRLHEDLTRGGLSELMGRSRYGIHALKEEHFGMAAAEALMAGCIPFVHASGGQVEIVGNDPRLCYSDSDAADQIGAVLDSGNLQAALQRSLSPRMELFTVERFTDQIRAAAKSAIA